MTQSNFPKFFIPFLLSLIAIGIIIGGGFYIWQRYQIFNSVSLPPQVIYVTDDTTPSPADTEEDISTPSAETSKSNIIKVSNLSLTIPKTWRVDKVDPALGTVITTQDTPYKVDLIISIDQPKNGDFITGTQTLGVTADGGKIYEEVAVGGARFDSYIVAYDSVTYRFQWDLRSTQVNPEAEGIWTPDHNFTQADLLTIVKSSSVSR